MDFELYRKCIWDMTDFHNLVKVLRIAGVGEPLLHRNIVEMLNYAVELRVAEKVEMITNGSLLSPPMARDIIATGIHRLLISIEGTSARKYKEISAIDIDFNRFRRNLEYLYEIKGKTHIHIKIASTALEGKEDLDCFLGMFGDICDTIGVEQIVPIFPCVDFKNLEATQTQYGLTLKEVKICPQPFYTMQINPDGKVVPCYNIVFPEIMGDCHNESVERIWNGPKFVKFRQDVLLNQKYARDACIACNVTKYRLFPEDDLDEYAEELIEKCR
jgi:radical SAM protein with 4Fe4S-binding SPASM domain